MSTPVPDPDSPRSRVGRPRRVQMQAVIDAALEIGLERVTLKQIAERIGVAPATLYAHVRNRDELIRLATFQLMLARRMPANDAGHWSEVAALYAESLHEVFVGEPLLLQEVMRGRLGPHAEVDVLEQFLAVMERHGLDAAEGVELFHAIGTLVLGTATASVGLRASEAGDTPWPDSLAETLMRRGAELPRVSRALPQVAARPYRWTRMLAVLLAGFAAERGERLPGPADTPRDTRNRTRKETEK